MNVSVYHMSTVPKEGAGSPRPRVIDGWELPCVLGIKPWEEH